MRDHTANERPYNCMGSAIPVRRAVPAHTAGDHHGVSAGSGGLRAADAAEHRMIAQHAGLGLGSNLHGTDHRGVGKTAVGDKDEIDRAGLSRSVTMGMLRWPFSRSDGIRHANRRETFHPEPFRHSSCRNQLRHRYCRHQSNSGGMDSKLGGHFSQEIGWINAALRVNPARRGIFRNLVIEYVRSQRKPSPLWGR